MSPEIWQVQQRQSLPLEAKVELTRSRIRAWYQHWGGDAYIAFSGGVDSTVLLDIARREYPGIPAVFCDTGLEFPEVRDFVKTVPNVTWIRPKMPFATVLDRYGYPVISKEQAQYIREYKHTDSEKLRQLRWEGRPDKRRNGKIAERYKFLIDAPFELSEQCCDVMKKRPMHAYNKVSGQKPITAVMAEDSILRRSIYMRYGCNAYTAAEPVSRPMSFWRKDDVWEYIRSRDLPYASVYDMGWDRTGCVFCMFGVHLEKEPNRFQRLKETHPGLHDYCIHRLGLCAVLDYIGVRYE